MKRREVYDELELVNECLNAALGRLNKVLDEADHEALVGYGGEEYCLRLARATNGVRRSILDLGGVAED